MNFNSSGGMVMRKAIVVVFASVFLLFGAVLAMAGEKAPQKIVDLANGELVGYGTDGVLVGAVLEENGKGKTLEQIKELDEKWKGTAGVDAGMKELMENACAKRLKEISASAPYYSEIFVMDDKGANVCMTEKTSDYWQGDEAKFQKSFADGKGQVFVDDVEFDDSSQAYLVQASVPVMDGDKAIGAITFGIDVDKVK
jgi:hypothetical protein